MNALAYSPLAPCMDDADADFRQLRHQTKNALANILLCVSRHLRSDRPASDIAAQVERRILLTAAISDALFGLTRVPGQLEDRLRVLCGSMIELLGDPDQVIRFDVSVSGPVPPALHELLLRVAHELVGNAVKHGMHMRLMGRIRIAITAEPDLTVLEVTDDGWGCGNEPRLGEGLRVANLLAAPHGAAVLLRRRTGQTVATLQVPAE